VGPSPPYSSFCFLYLTFLEECPCLTLRRCSGGEIGVEYSPARDTQSHTSGGWSREKVRVEGHCANPEFPAIPELWANGSPAPPLPRGSGTTTHRRANDATQCERPRRKGTTSPTRVVRKMKFCSSCAASKGAAVGGGHGKDWPAGRHLICPRCQSWRRAAPNERRVRLAFAITSAIESFQIFAAAQLSAGRA